MTDIKDEKQPTSAPADELVMADEELDRVFGGMTGTYVCASQLQSSVMQ